MHHNDSPTVAVNEFVRRQVKGSGKTYSEELTFEEIATHAAEQMERGFFKDGYRDGVVLVAVDEALVDKFRCPFVRITEDIELIARSIKRRPEEEPYIQIRANNGSPLPAGKVELILYRHDVLAENDEQSTNTDWELISIHAIPEGVETLPMGPVTMMRNQLELPGGTAAHYSSEEWAEAVRFWQHYAAVDPSDL